jgi:hypothetical protein
LFLFLPADAPRTHAPVHPFRSLPRFKIDERPAAARRVACEYPCSTSVRARRWKTGGKGVDGRWMRKARTRSAVAFRSAIGADAVNFAARIAHVNDACRTAVLQ